MKERSAHGNAIVGRRDAPESGDGSVRGVVDHDGVLGDVGECRGSEDDVWRGRARGRGVRRSACTASPRASTTGSRALSCRHWRRSWGGQCSSSSSLTNTRRANNAPRHQILSILSSRRFPTRMNSRCLKADRRKRTSSAAIYCAPCRRLPTPFPRMHRASTHRLLKASALSAQLSAAPQ